MGSYAAAEAEDSCRCEEDEEVHVLVTGAGPFLNFTTNPSYLIASSLPKTIEAPKLPKIHIHAYHEPIRVAYEYVRTTIPGLIFSEEPSSDNNNNNNNEDAASPQQPKQPRPKYDVVLHIGMASGRAYYTLETRAPRDGYTAKDVDGETMSEDTLWKDEYRAPETLHTSFDTDDVWRRWKAGLPDEDLRPSDDPGRYLCGFMYYTSLVEYWRHGGADQSKRPVMFLHVPGGYSDDDLESGRKVTLGLIEALVGSLKKGRGE